MECEYLETVDISVGNDIFDHPTYRYYCHKKDCEIPRFRCAKCQYHKWLIKKTLDK